MTQSEEESGPFAVLPADGLERSVRIAGKDERSEPLSSLLDKDAVILLGDPGMGKSLTMEAVAARLGGRCDPAIGFLPTRREPRPGGILVIDGLDEVGSSRGAVTPLEEVIQTLSDLGWPQFWLSCRAADWERASGSLLLQAGCWRRQPVVAHLLPLSGTQIDAMIEAGDLDPLDVRRGLDNANLLPLLGNPQTLRMILDVFKDGGAPSSRTDLYERAVAKLAEERKDRLGGSRRPRTAAIVDTAGAVATVLLLSSGIGVSLNSGTEGRVLGFADCEELAKPELVAATLGSNLFREAAAGCREPVHRTVAEFLGAKYLAGRIAKGMPLGRTVALLCDGHPDPVPPLRGLFAWLAVHLPDRADEFVNRDPYGVITYGDPSKLRLGTLRALIFGLRKVAEREPLFRGARWHDASFRAFSIPELVPELRAILRERPANMHLVGCVLDALEQGEKRPELATDLEAFITDGHVEPYLREVASAVFARVASEEENRALFARLLPDDEADPDALLSGRLILLAYPAKLSTDDLVAFLYRYVHAPGTSGRVIYLDSQTTRFVPEGREPDVMDRLAEMSWSPAGNGPASRMSEVKRFARTLAARSLPARASVSPERALRWLPLISFREPYPPGRREKNDVREVLEKRPDLYIPMLVHVWHNREQAHPSAAGHLLSREFPGLQPPSDLFERALEAVEAAPEDDAAPALYYLAMNHAAAEGNAESEGFLRAWSVADNHVHLRAIRDTAMRWELENHDDSTSNAGLVEDGSNKRLSFKKEFAREPTACIKLLRRGQSAKNWLGRLAGMWFGQECEFFLETLEMSPRERLRAIVPSEVAQAAIDGFRLRATRGPIIDADEITAQARRNRLRTTDIAALAGADLLFGDAPELVDALGADRCAGLFLTSLVHQNYMYDSEPDIRNRQSWTARIIVRHEEACSQALERLFTMQLKQLKAKDIWGLHAMLEDLRLKGIRTRLLPILLGVVPAPDDPFNIIARATALECERGTLEEAVRRRLAAASDKDRWPWLHLAWRLSPAEHEEELGTFLAGEPERVWQVISSLGGAAPFLEGFPISPVTLSHRTFAIRQAASLFPPVAPSKRRTDLPSAFHKAQAVATQIRAIGETPGAASEAALLLFVADESLSEHRYSMQAALSVWRATMRLASWVPSSIEDIMAWLTRGTPASAADLHGFVVDHLTDLCSRMHKAAGSPWLQFWNRDNGVPTSPLAENDCRNVIVSMLQSRFELCGLSQGTEVAYREDTRCDIVVGKLNAFIPVEVKCDWHPRLWTAWKEQLDAFYACEPTAHGFGIYLVLWFGEPGITRGGVHANPSTDIAPVTAAECLAMLRADMAADLDRLTPVVLDVSPPGQGKKGKAAKARKNVRQN